MRILDEISLYFKIKKQLKNFDMKNWKTSLSGLVPLLLTGLHMFFPSVVTSEVVLSATGLLTGLGLLNAKDHNVTGGTVAQ